MSDIELRELAKKVHEKLTAHPHAHISNCMARDSSGLVCDPIVGDAHCFCLIGAVKRVVHEMFTDFDSPTSIELLYTLKETLGIPTYSSLIDFNDASRENRAKIREALLTIANSPSHS